MQDNEGESKLKHLSKGFSLQTITEANKIAPKIRGEYEKAQNYKDLLEIRKLLCKEMYGEESLKTLELIDSATLKDEDSVKALDKINSTMQKIGLENSRLSIQQHVENLSQHYLQIVVVFQQMKSNKAIPDQYVQDLEKEVMLHDLSKLSIFEFPTYSYFYAFTNGFHNENKELFYQMLVKSHYPNNDHHIEHYYQNKTMRIDQAFHALVDFTTCTFRANKSTDISTWLSGEAFLGKYKSLNEDSKQNFLKAVQILGYKIDADGVQLKAVQSTDESKKLSDKIFSYIIDNKYGTVE